VAVRLIKEVLSIKQIRIASESAQGRFIRNFDEEQWRQQPSPPLLSQGSIAEPIRRLAHAGRRLWTPHMRPYLVMAHESSRLGGRNVPPQHSR
jgi:hypothetical protein